jgi:HK97 family phage major capsid protein
VTAATGSSTLFKVADVVAAYKALPAAYRPAASWIFHPDDFASLAGTTDSAGALAIPSLSFAPPSLLGLPVFLDANMPAPAASAKSAAIGAWRSAYAIRRVQQPTVDRLTELHSDSGQVGYRVYGRVDGRPTLTDAARLLAHSAT